MWGQREKCLLLCQGSAFAITGAWCVLQVLGESMAGISQNAKNSKLPEFGDSISTASKALCGLTEAAAQVRHVRSQP